MRCSREASVRSSSEKQVTTRAHCTASAYTSTYDELYTQSSIVATNVFSKYYKSTHQSLSAVERPTASSKRVHSPCMFALRLVSALFAEAGCGIAEKSTFVRARGRGHSSGKRVTGRLFVPAEPRRCEGSGGRDGGSRDGLALVKIRH